ncbi:MAG: hypothetical protein ACJAWZ_003713 [Paracoccaceae bacterium]
MLETPKLSLPLLAAGQAQKHIPVNEALSRLDALFMLSVFGRSAITPPASPSEGDRWIVPTGATGDWTGDEQRIAVWINGGWDYIDPQVGWRCWVEDEGIEVLFDSGVWSALIVPGGGVGVIQTLSFEHAPTGSVSDTAGLIPASSVVFGVTARVIQPLTGVSGWSLGVNGAAARYGSGLGIALNATVKGPTTAPISFTSGVPLRLTGEGGAFTGGRVALSVHYMTLSIPDAV